jgi:hypothetical protein
VQHFLVILHDLYGHVERLGDEERVSLVHAFGDCVFGRVDESERGFTPGSSLGLGTVGGAAASIVVSGVHQLVDERATPGEVGQRLVDDDETAGGVIAAAASRRQFAFPDFYTEV